MTPAGKKRFCADCKKHVHDLSRMSEEEARTLMSAPSTEDLCVRYVYDELGKVVFDMDQKMVMSNALVRAKRFVQTAVVVALPLSLTACMGSAPRPMLQPAPKTSEVAPMPVAPPVTPATTPDAGTGGSEKRAPGSDSAQSLPAATGTSGLTNK